MSGYHDHYQQAAARTASPAQLVLMLFDGVLLRLDQALWSLEEPRDLPATHSAIMKAQRIVDELALTLDHAAGGVVAGNLASIYDYVGEQLLTANIEKRPEPLHEARARLAPLRDAWETACVGMPVAATG